MVSIPLPAIFLENFTEDILLVLQIRLETAGYKVLTAGDGKAAWETLQKTKPDLAILDIQMPYLNGWEVCRKIRQDRGLGSLPVIILTAKSQNQDELMSYECGADRYISKPFDDADLLKAIKELEGA